MSNYRGQVDRLTTEIAQLEAKAAAERLSAAKNRASGLRTAQSITKSTSTSSAQTKLRDAQRQEERATTHDRQAAQYSAQIATKRRSLSDAHRNLERAEEADRKKRVADDERRRRDESRRRTETPRVPMFVYPTETPEASGSPVAELPTEQADLPAPLPNREINSQSNEPIRDPDPHAAQGVPDLPAETTIDAALEVGKAVALGALASIPALGPILRELVGSAWGDNRADRLYRFATVLGTNVQTLEERIDHEFIRRDEFEGLAEDALERVLLRRNEKKIPKFAATVAHAATTDRPDERARERFLDLLDALRPAHLALLARLSAGTPGWSRPGDVITVGQVVNSKLAFALGDVGGVGLDWKDLEQRGLVHGLDDTGALVAGANDIRALLTPLGRDFLGFVTMGQERPVDATDRAITMTENRTPNGQILSADDDPKWVHAWHAALADLHGSFDPTEEASRQAFLEAIHDRGYPDATLEYVPSDGKALPRILLRSARGRPS